MLDSHIHLIKEKFWVVSEFFELLESSLDTLNLIKGQSEKSQYCATKYDFNEVYSDNINQFMPSGHPGFWAISIRLYDLSGKERLRLSLGTNNKSNGKLYLKGEIDWVSFWAPSRINPLYLINDIEIRGASLEFTIEQYELVKKLHHLLDADTTMIYDHKQEFLWGDADYRPTIEGGASWFSKEGPQKLIKPLEENRLPVDEDFLLNERTNLPNWAVVVDKPSRECWS